MRRVGIIVGFVALALAGAAAAQTTISGVVQDVDQGTRVIVFQDGRAVKLDDRSVILVDNRPVHLSTLKPGTVVIVTSEAPAVRSSTLPPARPRGVPPPMAATVVRVDSAARTIVLSDGRVIQTGPDTVLIVENRPIELATVAPGDVVVVRYGEPGRADYPAALVRDDEPGGTAVVRRGEAAAHPERVEPWPANVPESEMMYEPQAP